MQEASQLLATQLADELMGLDIDEAVPLTRACGHYLNLTGIAELQHRCVRASVQLRPTTPLPHARLPARAPRAAGSTRLRPPRPPPPTCRLRRNRIHQSSKSCDVVFGRLISEGMAPEDLYTSITNQAVEIVLTAHPTQVNRRTLTHKYTKWV
jgi:phosphoenolpyruvate carboxylase